MITLRDFTSSDKTLLVEYLNNKLVTRYITAAIPQPYTFEDAQWWLTTGCLEGHVKAIEYNGVFVGCISAKVGDFEYSRSAELGYWIAEKYWNNGIATKAISLFTQRLFSTTDLVRLFVSVVSVNKSSIQALKKNDFTHEGLLQKASYKDGEFFDECILSKLKT